MQPQDMLDMTSTIVAAYASRNEFGIGELPEVIRTVHSTLAALGAGVPADAQEGDSPTAEIEPEALMDTEDGVIRDGIRTVYDDHLVCLDDRREVVFLTRHLHRLGISPEEYRAKWSLPPSYPMVAPAYARRKRDLAIAAGLGRSDGIRPHHALPALPAEPEPVRTPMRRRRTGTLRPAYGGVVGR